jgi:hypothetical protein
VTRRKATPFVPNPFTIWTTLALRTGEMLWASGQVIGHRTSRVLLADPKHKERDRRELALMSMEKLEAGAGSWAAMTLYLTRLNMQYAAGAFGQWMAMSQAMLSVANSRSMGQALGQQAKLAQLTATGAAETVSRMTESAARLAHRGLKPIHSRATKNAKRLGKR